MKKIKTAKFVDAVPIESDNKYTLTDAMGVEMVYGEGELLILTRRKVQIIVPANNIRYLEVKLEETKTAPAKSKTATATA